MRGYIIIENLRTGEKRRAYGVFTRNFAYLILHVLNTSDSQNEEKTLKNVVGEEHNIYTRVNALIQSETFFYQNVYTYLNNVSMENPAKVGLIALLTTSDYTPSPEDYALPSVDLNVELSSKQIVLNPNNTVIIYTGASVTPNPLTVKGVGIANALYPRLISDSGASYPRIFLIDGFAITPIEFSANDVVSVSYRITLA
jgi:hypothetical protein